MIKAIVFDIDNTLYDYDAAHAAAFQAVTGYSCQAFGLTEEEFAALHRRCDKILRQRVGSLTAAVHNRLLRYQIMLEEIGQPVSCAPKMADRYWSVFLDAVKPAPGLYSCLDYLKSNRYLVGIGTNMTADYQFAKLEKLGILENLNFIVSSEEAGAEKPARRLFDFCVEKAGCTAGECAFVGDSLENDARGALAAGLLPVWLCAEPGECETEIRTIPALPALPALLESI